VTVVAWSIREIAEIAEGRGGGPVRDARPAGGVGAHVLEPGVVGEQTAEVGDEAFGQRVAGLGVGGVG
jgi:hypothetical protein